VDWLNAGLYDLCISLDSMPMAVAKDLVIATANQISGLASETADGSSKQ
jgi:hypothetical protein